MSRKQLSLSPEKISPFDLEAFMKKATELNRKTREIFTTPFPKASSRWLSYYQFRPRPIEFTSEGEVEGGLSWLISSVIDFVLHPVPLYPLLLQRRWPLLRPGQLLLPGVGHHGR